MAQNLVTRFAPSPTGRLHLGHAYSALLAHDVARGSGGTFCLRMEDIDKGRSRTEFADGIVEDLQWLGLNWDGEIMIQSDRTDIYDAALRRLIEARLAYRCWCTRGDIAASAPQGEPLPLYFGTCKGRTDPSDGRPFCWRLDVEAAMAGTGLLLWHDAAFGSVRANPALLGDVVIARKDAATSYHLAVTVDDAAQGVTDVVRGRDLFQATHIHRLLQAILGLPTPRYHHHALIHDETGQRLAKRRGSISLANMRQGGADPLQLISCMRQGRFPVGFALEGS